MRIASLIATIALAAFSTQGHTQQIDQTRGADSRVDYSTLNQIGPWDDRNYSLTTEDLALLAPNERDLKEGIPAFYRVELRRKYPDLLREGPAQYPRSALPRFLIAYTGFLVDGKFYRQVQREGKRWHVLTEAPVARETEGGGIEMLVGEARITSPTGAAESTIEINPVDPNIVVAGSNGPGSGQKMHFSTDGGATWTQSAALPLGGTCCDPTIGWSSDGTLAYAATLGSQNYFYRSSDNGQTWNDLGADPRREISVGGGVDKEFLHVDHSPSSPHRDNIYLTWHESNIMRFARSTDFGDTWSVQSFSSASSERGIGSDITTDKAGNVYYIWPAFNSRTIKMKKSTNGGASFGSTSTIANTQASFIFSIPSIETRDVFVYVSADTDRSAGPFADSIYAAWTDSTASTGGNPNNNHARIQVAYSRNGGNSWTVTTPHPTADANSVDRWHQWLSVDPAGNVHIIFYDTTGDASRSSVNLYYTFSEDGAQTFSPLEKLTSQASPNISDSFEFGDYNGLASTLDHVIASFTDNRNEGGGGGNSVDIYAAGTDIGGGAGGDNIGGTTSGLFNGFGACRNNATSQLVTIPGLAGNGSYDCTAAGLAATGGQTVLAFVRGNALCGNPGGTCDVSEVMSGMVPGSATCRNLTTSQVVAGTVSGQNVDCAGGGLNANQGQRVTILVTGTAD